MMEAEDIWTAANVILTSIEGIFAAAEVELPARRFITIGGPTSVAHTCEQLTVCWDQSYSGTPGNQDQVPQKCDGIRTGRFIVELVLCGPEVIKLGKMTGTITPEAYSTKAYEQMKAAALLYNAGMIAGEGTILEAGLVDLAAGELQGEFQAIIMNVLMAI